jgi:hypothetical protein
MKTKFDLAAHSALMGILPRISVTSIASGMGGTIGSLLCDNNHSPTND